MCANLCWHHCYQQHSIYKLMFARVHTRHTIHCMLSAEYLHINGNNNIQCYTRAYTYITHITHISRDESLLVSRTILYLFCIRPLASPFSIVIYIYILSNWVHFRGMFVLCSTAATAHHHKYRCNHNIVRCIFMKNQRTQSGENWRYYRSECFGFSIYINCDMLFLLRIFRRSVEWASDYRIKSRIPSLFIILIMMWNEIAEIVYRPDTLQCHHNIMC